MTVLYNNDFEAAANGALAEFSVLANSNFQVGTNNPVRGTKTFGKNSDKDSTYWNGNTTIGNQAIRHAQKFISGTSVGQLVRMQVGAGAAMRGYHAYYQDSGGNLRVTIREYDNGTISSQVSAYNIPVVAGDTVHMETRAVGNVIECRVWTNSNARPSTPSQTLTSSSYASGAAGMFVTGVFANVGCDDLVITDSTGGEDFYYSSSDTTPPNLSSPVGTQTGTTTATVGATTDEGNGTMYSIVSTSNTPPSVAQIQAGQMASGSAAPWAGNQAVSSAGAKTFGATGLSASTTYYSHTQHKDAAGNNSTVVTSASFTTAAAGDTTPPNLSAAVGTATGTTTATVGATTDEGNGTMYAVVTTSSTPPSAAQVMAGQTNTGAAAPWSGNIAISSTGAKTLNATGLTASTAYYAYMMHRDAAGNNSTVLASSVFTTSAAAQGRITTPPIKNNAGTLLASISGWTVNVYNASTGALVVQKTGLSTDSSGVITFTDVAVVTGTSYVYECVHATYGRRMPAATAT